MKRKSDKTQGTSSLFNTFNISSRILSSAAVFPDFNPRRAAAISVNVKTPSFPKFCIARISGCCSYWVQFHAIGEWSAKLLCLPMNSWNPTDDQIPSKSVLRTFLLPKLQIFSPLNIGIANRMMTCLQ